MPADDEVESGDADNASLSLELPAAARGFRKAEPAAGAATDRGVL